MKNFKRALLTLITIMLIGISSTKSEAKNLSDEVNKIGEGVTSEGVAYEVYIVDDETNSINPNIVVSKKFTISVIFDGNITPPKTWSTTIQEGAVSYSGTLYRGTYSFDNFLNSKKTVAEYSGTLCGLL